MGICALHVERPIPAKKRVNYLAFKFFDKVALAREAKHIGDLIRKKRVASKMTQAELAEVIGVREWAIFEWESGRYRPRRHKREVAEWLGVTVESLFSVVPNQPRPGRRTP